MRSKTSKKPNGTSSGKSSESDLDAAASSYRESQKPKCVTCQNRAATEKIREYVQRVDAGTLNLPVPGLLGVLRGERYGYKHDMNALYRHIRNCVRGRG